tara:strand:+ start:13838 stop:14875 length:1038 start_codon:yes stop_codon:yes gene_type:complete
MVDYVEQITREAPDIEARRLGLLDSALGLSRQPVGGFQYDSAGAPVMENVIDPTTGLPQLDADGNPIQRPVRAGLPGQDIVGLSPQQQQAIQLGGAGIGAFEPYLANAQTQQTAGLSTLGQAAQQFTAPTDANISQFMNPFQQSIRDEINRSYDIAEQGAAAQAIQSGAFGGDREGIQRAELDRNRATALARAQADSFLNAQQRQLQGAQGLAGLAPQYGAFAGQQAQLGATGQQLAGQDINTLLGLGQLGQQFGVTDPTTGAFTPGQAQVEAQRQNTLQNLYEPYQRVGFLSDIYAGAPSSTQTITSSTGPAAPPPISPLRQIAGYAGLGLGALSGLSGLQGLF